jgi:hypothetical protein
MIILSIIGIYLILGIFIIRFLARKDAYTYQPQDLWEVIALVPLWPFWLTEYCLDNMELASKINSSIRKFFS